MAQSIIAKSRIRPPLVSAPLARPITGSLTTYANTRIKQSQDLLLIALAILIWASARRRLADHVLAAALINK